MENAKKTKVTKDMQEYYVSRDGGKTFRKELLTKGQIQKKREMGQIVNKHPCHLCWHWYNRTNYVSENRCHSGKKSIEGGVCMEFDPTPEETSIEEQAQGLYDRFNDEWN